MGSERADLGPDRGLRGGTDVRTDGRLEIHPRVLQDIGPLEPLPKKKIGLYGFFACFGIQTGFQDSTIDSVF